MNANVTDRLKTLIKDGIDVHRCAAARALGVIRTPQATGDLVLALLDEDPDVRVDAAIALARIQDPKTAAKLMENLIGDPDAAVKKVAISALVAMKYQPIVPLLRALAVTRAEDKVAWDEDEFYSEGWDSWVDIQIAAINGLSEFAVEEAVGDILAALSDEMGQDVTEPGYHALARMGQAGARALSDIYQFNDARLCRRIARAVGDSDNPYVEDLRSEMLAGDKPAIRALALQYLAPTDTRLAALFKDPDAAVRAGVVRHAGAKHLALLRAMIADVAPDVRKEVFKVIAAYPAEFKNKADINAVKNTLKGDPEAAKHAALALFALQGPKVANGFFHVLGNHKIPRDFRLGVLETLEKAGDVAVPALMIAAGDPDRQMRLASLTVLANIAANAPDWPNNAAEGLLLALKGELVLPPEDEPEEEEVAPEPEPVTAPDQAELDEINREIDESLPLVAEDAAPGSTLRSIMSNEPDAPIQEPQEIVLNETQERLLEMTNTRKFSKRKVSWQTEIAPYLDVQRFSARLLGQVVHPEVTEELVAVLADTDDDEIREAVLFSLVSHGETIGTLPVPLADTMQELLNSANSETRVLATRVLGWVLGDDINTVLKVLLDNEDQLVRVEAIHALAHRGVACDAVKAALQDPYLGVGIAAARALARVRGDDAVDALMDFVVENDGIYRAEIGKLLGQYAPETGAARLLDLLNDETRKALWLVAIDALAELYQQQVPDKQLLVA